MLTARDQHLFGPGPKRILALDGGGMRGVVSIAFLDRLEKIVEAIEGRPVLLGDWFDMIGGTSTGAIIATLLALGYRATEIRDVYEELGPRIFKRSLWRITGIQSKFDSSALVEGLRKIVGSRELGSDDLHTGLCVVTKRVDTGSPWIVANNPRSAYWETPADRSFIGNRYYPLVNLIRASTAAPHYFEPELIPIVPEGPPGLFVDGGVSPYNNPSLALLQMAALPQHGLNWPLGPDNLTVVSIGTGSFRQRIRREDLPLMKSLALATQALTSQIIDGEQLVLTMMSWLGECPTSWSINSELGDVGATAAPLGRPLFRFVRYNIRLDSEWLESELNSTLPAATLKHLQSMDSVTHFPLLYDLAARAAAQQISSTHFSAKLPAGNAQVDAQATAAPVHVDDAPIGAAR